ncbi:hypothetical protein BV908_08905 [Diaphorobacter sp. LR2014-1]|nr:hypothetical protein BV908_08905 [Diaphorobacter sp. LR2014-1]
MRRHFLSRDTSYLALANRLSKPLIVGLAEFSLSRLFRLLKGAIKRGFSLWFLFFTAGRLGFGRFDGLGGFWFSLRHVTHLRQLDRGRCNRLLLGRWTRFNK